MTPRQPPPTNPAGPTRWQIRFATAQAAATAQFDHHHHGGRTETIWHALQRRPERPTPSTGHHPLKGRLATAIHAGTTMARWQYTISADARLWYLTDTTTRTLRIRHISTPISPSAPGVFDEPAQ